MEKDRLSPICSTIGTFSFSVFGFVAFMNLRAPFRVTNIIFGVLIGLIFGFISKFFFTRLLSLLNSDIRKNREKGAIRQAVKRSTVSMLPYATLCFLASYFLGWATAAVFFSAGIMNTGVTVATEVSKLKEKPSIKNNIASSVISSGISYLWMFSAVKLGRGLALTDTITSLLSNVILPYLGVKK